MAGNREVRGRHGEKDGRREKNKEGNGGIVSCG